MAYSDTQASEALIRLAINKYDYKLTSKQVGIPERTLRRWDKNVTKKGVPELLERAIERMLMVIPETWHGQDWAIALGILIDKYQLMHGEPTARIENIFTAIQNLPDDELNDLINQFEQAANSGRVDAGENGEGEA